ncbi:unnamed protein product [Absidia cylindrospora]
MGVQAAIAFLNGNETAPAPSSHPSKRPIPPKATTSNWTAKPTSAVNLIDKKKDNTFANTKTNNTTTTKVATTTTAAAAPTTAPVAAVMTSRHTQKSRTIIDMLTEELTTQYQEALDKNDLAKEIITKLESDVELYACDSTKVRDYEIRVEYLAQKLEQVSEERDLLEQELSTYKDRHGSLVTPVSPAFGPDVFGGKTTMIEAAPTTTHQKNNMNQQHNEDSNNNDSFEKQHQQQQQRLEDIYFDEILDAYEERRSEDNDDMMQQQEHNEQMMAQMLAEYDQGMKMAMEAYVTDLEKQRLENKTLKSMVKKQDELIKKLETQYGDGYLSDEGDEQRLSQQQQRQQQQQQQQQRTSPSYRSSIDVLAEMARSDSVPGSSSSLSLNSIHHHQRDTGRNTPPPFAPPKTPLPPLPITDQSNTSINNDSLISYSRSSTSSTTWSSDEQEHHHQQHQNQQQQQHPLSTMTTGLPPKHNTIDDHHHVDHTSIVDGVSSLNNGATSGSFWNGLKKKF